MKSNVKRQTLALLAASLLLAVGIPASLAIRSAPAASTFMHDGLLAWQALPAALCAVLWLPWRLPVYMKAGRCFAAVLFMVTAAMYVPALVREDWFNGDMAPLAIMAAVVVLSGSLALLSLVVMALIAMTRRRRASNPSAPETPAASAAMTGSSER